MRHTTFEQHYQFRRAQFEKEAERERQAKSIRSARSDKRISMFTAQSARPAQPRRSDNALEPGAIPTPVLG
jgi:hypothetical protein